MIEVKLNAERAESYYRKGYWTHDTLLDIWNDRASNAGETVYITDERGASLTYGQVDEQAGRLAAWLAARGVHEGDVVTFQLPVWTEFAVVYVACLKLGAVIHPVSCAFNERDLSFIMQQVSSAAFICPTHFRNIDYDLQAINVIPHVGSLKACCVVGRGNGGSTRLPAFEDVVAAPAEAPGALKLTCADSVALILSTSGTTGKPKAVLLTHNNLIFSERAFTHALGLTSSDVMFMPAPLNHATGFNHGLISPLILGGRVVIQEHFEAGDAIALMNREGVTWSMGATPFIHDLLKHMDATGESPRTLRFYLCGGAPVPGELVRHARERGIIVCEVYGSTESCPHVLVPPAYALGWNGRFSGRALEGIEVSVVDGSRQPAPCGTQGEEASRGPNVFVGYLGDEEGTRAALDEDGWFYSGDLCVADERGRIRINGRLKEIIIRGGVNISAVEIDHAVTGCPGFRDHAAVGFPDARLGERICLFAVPEPGAHPTVESVAEYCKSRGVPKRLWPERVEPIDAIPRTESGKVKRNQLTDLAKQSAQPHRPAAGCAQAPHDHQGA